MSLEGNKAIVRRLTEMRREDLAAIDAFMNEMFAEDFVNHTPQLGVTPDREGFKQYWLRLTGAFPDLTFDVQDLIAEGDRVVCRSIVWGTHTGPITGPITFQPTGKKFEISAIFIMRIEGGKIIERWAAPDTFNQLLQLDLITFKGMG
jgi:predicted ester cyclase